MKTILAAIGTAFLSVCFGMGLNQMVSHLTSWDGSIALSSLFYLPAS